MRERMSAKLFNGSYRSVARWLQQGGGGGERFPRRWRSKDTVEPVRREPSITPMIYLDHGSHGTPEEAVDLFEGDAVILRRLAGPEPKAVLQDVEQCKTALDATAHASAH